MGRRFRFVTLCLILVFMVTGCAKKRHDTSDASVHRYEQFRQNYDAQGFYVQDEDLEDDGDGGQTGRKTKNRYGTPPKGDSAVTNIVLSRAHKSLGTPYHFGGTTPGGFDCSGFVQWAYKGAGIKLPRTAQEQSLAGYKIRDKSQLRAGDIVAFRRRGGYHTGIYIGNGKFIHAPRRNQTVRVESLDTDYFARNYIGGRRIDGSRRSAQLAQATQKEDREYQSSGRKSKKQQSVSRSKSKKEQASSKSRSSKKEQASSKSRSDKKEQASSKSRSDRKEQASSKSRSDKKEQASSKSRASKKENASSGSSRSSKQDTSRSKGSSNSKDSASKKDRKQKDTSASSSKSSKKQDASQAKSKDTSSASSSKKSKGEVKQQERKIEVRRSSKSSSSSSSSDQKKKD